MCGLFGWYMPSWPKKVDRSILLRQLARKNQSRGDDSFGIATLFSKEVRVSKFVGPASQWLEKNKRRLKEFSQSPILIGHTRMPSQGKVNMLNAHPFNIGGKAGDKTFPTWVLAHNGTINNSGELMNESLLVAKGETDSEETGCFLVQHDFSAEAHRRIYGMYAMTSVRKDGKEMVIAVDESQTFYIAWFEEGVVWSSEEGVLKSSLEAAGIHCDVQEVTNTIIRWPGVKMTPTVEPIAIVSSSKDYEEFDKAQDGTEWVVFNGSVMSKADADRLLATSL